MDTSFAAPTTRRRPGRVARTAALATAVGLVAGVGIGASAGADPAPHKVTICHATASATTPYVQVTVDYHSVVQAGHGGHDGPVFAADLDGAWGDVIPAFELGGVQFAGRNLDERGQALLDHGCAAPAAPTTTAPVTTTTVPVTTTTVVNDL